MASNIITLDVSGRKFRTTKATLSVSPWFNNLFERWETNIQPNGSYFIDADADIFEHLLNFMRRPGKFPLYWTKKDGFDYVLYSKLEAEADYFMLEGLRNWIKERKYLGAILTQQRIHYSQTVNWLGDLSLQNLAVKGEGGYACPSRTQGQVMLGCQDMRPCKHGKWEWREGEQKLVTFVVEVTFNEEVLVNAEG